jgi:CPA1 family monovalent cation:H+ antiporter
MMSLDIEQVELLLLIAAVVSMIARRLKLPYTIGLVFTGFFLALSPLRIEIQLSKRLIFDAFLPPLIFEAAFFISWRMFREEIAVLLTLATLGVLASAGLVAAGLRYGIGWPWETAVLFGILISATDPVAVIALFKDLKVEGKSRLLVEAESLLNDGTVAVMFGVALAFSQGGAVSPGEALRQFMVVVFGSVVCGALIGGAALLLSSRTNDHLVEITFTTIIAYGSFLFAEHFHFSGVLATLTAGLITGNVGVSGAMTEQGINAVESFWEYVTFAVNSLIFLLIGFQLARQDFRQVGIAALLAILLVLIGRAVAVYGCCLFFSFSSHRVERRYQHILVWGGLRGALALALALGLPANLPFRYQIVALSFAVVAFSVIAQGLTMTPLLRKLRII